MIAARFAFLLLGYCCLACPASACAMSEDQRLALFKTWDNDHDGGLTEAEYIEGESVRLKAAHYAVIEEALQTRYRNMLRPGATAVNPHDLVPQSLTRC